MIIQYPNHLLSTVCEPIEDFIRAEQIANEIIAINSQQKIPGIGLSAPQIGHR